MGRTIIVGDVHGCRAELDALLDRVLFATGDRLVMVGDLIARGPDSRGVLDIARQTGAVIVRGNHEEKLIAWRHARTAWLHGEAAAQEPIGRLHRDLARTLRPVDWTLLETSPVHYDLPEHGARVVHAGIIPGVPFDEQKRATLMRVRTLQVNGTRKGAHVLWATYYQGPPHIVFGHNAAPGLQLHPWATGLDTGCVYGGRLTAMVLEGGQRIPRKLSHRRELLVSQAARRVYYDARATAADYRSRVA